MIGIISCNQLRDAVSSQYALSAVHDSLLQLAAGRVIQPPAVEIRVPGHGELHVKGGHVVGDEWIVVKVARAWPDLASAGPLTRREDAITVADLCGIGAADVAIAAAARRGINLP